MKKVTKKGLGIISKEGICDAQGVEQVRASPVCVSPGGWHGGTDHSEALRHGAGAGSGRLLWRYQSKFT